MKQERLKVQTLDSFLQVVFIAKGTITRESVGDLECGCKNFGLMTMDPDTLIRSEGGISFQFVCATCDRTLAYSVPIPFTCRVRRQMFVLNAAFWSFFSGYRRLLLVVGLLLALAGVATTRYVSHGFKILLNEGPRQALSWMTDPRTSREKYLRAQELYSSEEFEEARKELKPLLKIKHDLKTRADSYYLAGLLAGKEDTNQAVGYFHHSAGLYSKLAKKKNMQQVYLATSQLLLSHGRLSRGENYFGMAAELPMKGTNMGFFRQVEARLFFEQGRYSDALNAGLKSYDFYQDQGDAIGASHAMSEIGFYRMLLGQMSAGLRDTLAAEVMVLDTGDFNLYFYNLINAFLYNRCMNLMYKPYADLISKRVKKVGDSVLERYLNFARDFPCPPGIARAKTTIPPRKGP